MLSYYDLHISTDDKVLNGFLMDDQKDSTMKALGLKQFRSCGKKYSEKYARKKDREKAIKLWGDKVNLSLYRIHHGFNGLVGLVPKDLHTTFTHYGYFWRLSWI